MDTHLKLMLHLDQDPKPLICIIAFNTILVQDAEHVGHELSFIYFPVPLFQSCFPQVFFFIWIGLLNREKFIRSIIHHDSP